MGDRVDPGAQGTFNHRRPKRGMRFIRLCMRVNCLKVEHKEIKMTYLITVLFLCVLVVSGMFQTIYEFWKVQGYKTHELFETSQKHPERIRTEQ